MTKILSSAIVAGLLLSVAAPVAVLAADAPKTKADCEKAKMKWDEATKKCSK
jgi:Spy/CpxP family protein refolding chaperone